MEQRLIDANALYDFCSEQLRKETGSYSKGLNNAFNIIRSALHNQCATPTIDAVAVVRCGECKHYEKSTMKCFKPVDDEHTFHDYAAPIWRTTDFCSYGERRATP